jgi:hypothetical protein
VNYRTRFAALALPLALAACGGGMASYKPVQEKTKFSEDDLFQAAVSVVESKGHPVTDRDSTSYTIKTREKEVSVSSVPRLSYKYQYTIVTKGGTLHISTTCTENSAMKRTEFEDCGDERPERLIKETDEIRAAILARAKGRK